MSIKTLIDKWLPAGPFTAVLLLTVLLVGAGGMLGQLLLLRELLVTFYGNELTLGIILGNWLLFEAAGALLAGRVQFFCRRPFTAYLIMLLLYAVLLPAAIFFSRGIPMYLFHTVPGETLGIMQLFLATLVLLAPLSMVHGSLFPLGCRALENYPGAFPIGKVYIYETLGTLLGGLVFTLILATRFHALELALGLCLLHLLACFVLLFIKCPQSGGLCRGGRLCPPVVYPKVLALRLCILGAALILLVSFSNLSEVLHQNSLSRQWRGQDILYYGNSPYGNIVTIYNRGEYTFFYDGRPVITVPVPDTAVIGDFAHIAAAAHPHPQKVLVLGSGLGGLLDELLKHPLQEIVCLELDPLLPQVVAAFPNPLTDRELGDRRVSIKPLDGRLYLARTANNYDLIILGFLTQDTLQTNRLFTSELFALAKEKLRPGGLLAFTIPGSAVYLDPQSAALNSSIYNTLKEEFAHLKVVPGDLNIFLASPEPFETAPITLATRLQERGLHDIFLTKNYLEYRFDREKQEVLAHALGQRDVRLNYDFNPAAFYYSIAHWGVTFSPGSWQILSVLESLQFTHYLAIIIIVFIFIVVLRRRITQPAALTFAIWSSGAAGMTFDLLLIFVFQCLYGYIYQMIGLLIAVFMTGTFCGGLWGGRGNTLKRAPVAFKNMEVAVLFLLPAFYVFALMLQHAAVYLQTYQVVSAVTLFALVAGFVVGAQFPLAAFILTGKGQDTGKIAGTLYGADLLGGWGAGLLISIILFPVLGLWQTLVLMFCLKLASLLAISIATKRSLIIHA